MKIFAKKSKHKPSPASRGRLSLVMAAAGTVMIIMLAVAKNNYTDLPMQLAGWLAGMGLAWWILNFMTKKYK